MVRWETYFILVGHCLEKPTILGKNLLGKPISHSGKTYFRGLLLSCTASSVGRCQEKPSLGKNLCCSRDSGLLDESSQVFSFQSNAFDARTFIENISLPRVILLLDVQTLRLCLLWSGRDVLSTSFGSPNVVHLGLIIC